MEAVSRRANQPLLLWCREMDRRCGRWVFGGSCIYLERERTPEERARSRRIMTIVGALATGMGVHLRGER